MLNKCIELFLSFFKIGAFTFGGGYAMVALIENECVERKKWITHDEMMDVTVIAESTPGPISINCATFVGYKYAGLSGAVSATLGVVVPAFVIIFVIATLLENFLDIKWVANAFKGIKQAVGILIIGAAVKMIKKGISTMRQAGILAFAFAVTMAINLFSVRLSTITLILIAAVVSLAVYEVGRIRGKGKK